MPDRTRRRATWLLTLALIAVAATALMTGDRRGGDRAYALEQRLRCPTCQSVSVADSPSDTAAAMRVAVREQVDAGRSDAEILAYFRDRYGSWVLLDPPVRGRTLLVWLLPGLAVAVAAVAVGRLVRRPAAGPPVVPLSREELDRVRAASARLPEPEGEE